MSQHKHSFIHSLDLSAVWTFIGIVVLFSIAVCVVLLAPNHIDKSWTEPTTPYMRQIYEVADPNLFVSSTGEKRQNLEFVYRLQNKITLLAFKETAVNKIVAPKELDKYVTKENEKDLKLTSRLLLLKVPADEEKEERRKQLQEEWVAAHPDWQEKKLVRPDFKIFELFDPKEDEAFALASTEGILEDWVDENFVLLDPNPEQKHHHDAGVIYVKNPIEYRVLFSTFAGATSWRYDPSGERIASLDKLMSQPLGFRSRQELIEYGEHLYAVSGCWYCHTDQTRTLVQDVVLNGSDSFPAPPSSANEYIYQKITFPGTKRNGPDISRVGIKKPSRDWHIGHFWSPKTASKGSIMPAFQHFFDSDPRGTGPTTPGVPNLKFEAIYQYLMTKGTRITPPTQAWWLGKDPVQTIEIIEGRKTIK